MKREHYRKKEQISDLFAEDTTAMHPLPSKRFTVCRLVKAKTDKYSFVRFENNSYSVAPEYYQCEVWIEISSEKLRILKYVEIASHNRRYGQDTEPIIDWIKYLPAISRKPNTLKYTGFFRQLPPIWQECFGNASYTDSKTMLSVLTPIILDGKLEDATVAMELHDIRDDKFDLVKTFEDYTFENIKIPKSITEEEIVATTFIDKKENLILYGNVGAGKTHLVIVTGIAACNNGKKVKFFRTATLVNELVDAQRQGTLVKLLKDIERCDLLICDEWGYVPVDSTGAKLLFGVIADCYERKSLIITTNLEFTKWNEIFADEKLTAATIDRIIHHSHLLDYSKRTSVRLKNSLIKLK